MSVFRVKLNNNAQGLLDTVSGSQQSTSIQRTVYVMGPKKINRKLKDGDTFTDSNYWKRFAYPQVSYADAIVEVVSDDGSVYSDVESENTFPVVYTKTVAAGSAYTANVCDILGDYGAPATFTQISHNGSAGQVAKVKLNGSSSAIFDLEYGDIQTFDSGDLQITKIEFDRTTSGAAGSLTIQVIVAIKASSNS